MRSLVLLALTAFALAADIPADPERATWEDLGDGRTRVWVPAHWGVTRTTSTEIYEGWIAGHWVVEGGPARPAPATTTTTIIHEVREEPRHRAHGWYGPQVVVPVVAPVWCGRGWRVAVGTSWPLWGWRCR